MKYIITEKQFKKISDLVLKEQTTTPSTIQPNSGMTINGISYKLPKINTQQELDKFTAPVSQEELVNIVGKGRLFNYPIKGMGGRLLQSLPEFLRVHAITGIPTPMDIPTLKARIDALLKNPSMKNYFINSPYLLGMLLNPTGGFAGDSKNILNYYQNLLKQRLS
jgi:hypothetical protein